MVFDEIEAKLSTWGIQGGVHALVLRWREHVLALEHASLRWEHHFDPGFPERQQASHDLGIFTLDATDIEGEWLLRHEWPGWGWREYGYGDAHKLKSRALELVRAGGPYGGPEHIFRRASPTAKSPASDMLRHALPGGELRIGDLAPGVGVVLQVRLDGTGARRRAPWPSRSCERHAGPCATLERAVSRGTTRPVREDEAGVARGRRGECGRCRARPLQGRLAQRRGPCRHEPRQVPRPVVRSAV